MGEARGGEVIKGTLEMIVLEYSSRRRCTAGESPSGSSAVRTAS
jgi:hypothetical protein